MWRLPWKKSKASGRDTTNYSNKMFKNMCEYYKVPLYFYGTKEALGHFIGKEYRASLALTDNGLAKAVEKQLLLANAKKADAE